MAEEMITVEFAGGPANSRRIQVSAGVGFIDTPDGPVKYQRYKRTDRVMEDGAIVFEPE